MKKIVIGALTVFVPASVLAFDVDGFRTGMTVNEVATAVQRQGWTLGPDAAMPGLRFEVHYDANGKVRNVGPASFSFCGSKLIAYTRQLDFDTEYAPKLRELIAVYGSQPRVTVAHDPWNGPNGGYVTSVRTMWTIGRERVYLTFEPEERAGDGSLKNYRGASLSYVFPNACR